jgi:vesicle coat complex subunit
MPINILHKETVNKDPLRRGEAIKTLTDMSVNEVYPFLYDVAKKGIYDNNPFVRKIALVSLFKVSYSLNII